MAPEYVAKSSIVELVNESPYRRTILELFDCLLIENVSRSKRGELGWVHDRASQQLIQMSPSSFGGELEKLEDAGAIVRSGRHWKITDAGARAYQALATA